MISLFVENATTLDFFRERANRTLTLERDKLDPGILPVVCELNKLEGLVPVWSCESHPVEKPHLSMYVTCVVDEYGIMHIENLYRTWVALLDSQPNKFVKNAEGFDTRVVNAGYTKPHQVFIRINRLSWPGDATRTYIAVRIGYDHVTRLTKEHALKTFLQAAIDIQPKI